MSALLSVTLGIVAGCISTAHAQSVHTKDGNVYFVPRSDAEEVQLTSSGRDRDPALSPDGKLVAFIRRPRGYESKGDRPGEPSELWMVNSDGTDPRLLLTGRGASPPAHNLTDLHSPRFSGDGGSIYFCTWAWATSGAIHVIDVQTRRTRFVTDGNGEFRIVPGGKYRGHLLTCHHKHFLLGGSYDWPWLVTPDGKDVAPVGPDCDERAVDKYLDELAR